MVSEVPPAIEPEKPDPRTVATRQMIQATHGRPAAVQALIRRTRFNAQPLDLGPVMMDTLLLICQAQAFILDELLALRGEERQVKVIEQAPTNGDGPSLVRP